MVSFPFNPIPALPKYTGPYHVGSYDVEVPAAELSSQSCPDPEVTTINFRLFYPSEPALAKAKPVYWLPHPQGEYLRAYFRFLSAAPWLASFLRQVGLDHNPKLTLC